MAAETRYNTECFTATEREAVKILKTATEDDRVLFNDRVQPLTVGRGSGLFEGRYNGTATLWLDGPQGGKYVLSYRDMDWMSEPEVILERHLGYEDNLPQRERISLSDIELVDHHEFRVGQVFDVVDSCWDEYYHVVTGIPDSGTYDVDTVGIRVSDGEVEKTEERGLFTSLAKERIFEGQMELVTELELGYGNRGRYYDREREEVVRLSDPHKRGVDLRPDEGHGLEVVDWGTMLFGFEDRFRSVDGESGGEQ
jgi:hypothetical protein